MKITVIGAGNMGSAFVKQLTRAGHEIRVTARDAAKAEAVAADNPGTEAVATSGSAANADVVVLATSYEDSFDALQAAGDLKDKVVIDITNPVTADFSGLSVGYHTSAAEEIARTVPGAEVVKAFNTIFAQVLTEGADFGDGRRAPVFLAADSDRAKATARALAEGIGFETIDAGPLAQARHLEPLGFLNIYFGYGAGHGTGIAPTWIRRN